PAHVLGQSLAPLLSPREDYERIGDVGNVVFACGLIVEDDGQVKVYYGAADTAICVATGDLEEIIASCFKD
ncbi:MAG: glycosidase, partial [Planctomycetes bacterium]|nr:glycosidase [Planctomycetota bacterium]